MSRLGVNIDHVATLRQARGGTDPDPLAAAVLVELAGADGIVVHLREDRRHIQDRDLRLLRELIRTKLDLEMAADETMAKIALTIKPDMVTLVPEHRQELTTEGGLDVAAGAAEPVVQVEVPERGIEVVPPHQADDAPAVAGLEEEGPVAGLAHGAGRKPLREIEDEEPPRHWTLTAIVWWPLAPSGAGSER